MVEDNTPVALNWFEEYERQLQDLYAGQILTGTVMQVRSNEVLIDVGVKSEGLVDSKELDELNEEERSALLDGAEVRVYVVSAEGDNGHPVLSISRAKMEQDWELVEEALNKDKIFKAEVTGSNRGGLIVHIGLVRAFVPASQIYSIRRDSGEGEELYQRRVSDLMGKELRFKVLELDRRRNRLILSERAAEREWRREQKEKLLNGLQKGDVIEGEVTSIASFGAFVDLGGADGLLHVSELSWGRVQHPNEVVQIGQKIDVYVLNIDYDRKRIGLSLKRLQPEPWSQFIKTYQEGDEVDAIITHLTNFGAFARIVDQEIEGLIHISELSNQHIERPDQVVSTGDVVRTRIIRIEPERKRLGLSMRLRNNQMEEDLDSFS